MSEPPQARDRDASGRARNARPRDAAGRPLPREASGVAQIPDDLHLAPSESLAEAQRLIDEGRPFAAHEVLESSWKTAPDEERMFWQSLAQYAVALTHLQRGNNTGARALFMRAADGLGETQDRYGVAVADLVSWCRASAERLESPPKAASQPVPVGSPPRLTG